MQLIQSGTKKLVSHADTVDQSRGCSCPTDDHGITASSAIIMSGVPSIAAMIARRRERQLCADFVAEVCCWFRRTVIPSR
jgi:hypothetical protein